MSRVVDALLARPVGKKKPKDKKPPKPPKNPPKPWRYV